MILIFVPFLKIEKWKKFYEGIRMFFIEVW
jgi:hypothetical protein